MIKGFQIQNLSGKKLSNYWRVYSSFKKANNGLVSVQGLPISISVEPTTACNLGCPQCPSGLKQFHRPTGSMKLPLFEKVLQELHPYLFNLTLYFQGEPFINKQFLEMAKLASFYKVYTYTSTNAHFLDSKTAKQTVESGLNMMTISIDGLSQKTYEKYRIGGSLEKVKQGLKNINYWKQKLKSKTPYTRLQFIVFSHNEHEVSRVKAFGKALGVNQVSIKTAQVYDFEKDKSMLPKNEKYSRYQSDQQGEISIKSALNDSCWRMWHSAVITWDGSVVPCCFDKDASHSLGHLENQSFKDIWYGQAYQNFREKLFQDRKSIDICSNCSEGSKVWV